jgi:hypothetical protein
MSRSVIFDVSQETVAKVADAMVKQHDDSLLVLAPLAGSISVYAPSKKGKYKGYHRLKFEVWIPEEAIKGESAIDDFEAVVLMRLPRSRVQEHLKNEE